MANQLYGYNPSYGGPGAAAAYSSKSLAESYLSDSSLLSSSRYLAGSDPSAAYSVTDRVSSLFLSHTDGLRSSADDIGGAAVAGYFSAAARISGAAAAATSAAGMDPVAAALKRPTEALYHQTVLGSHNTYGQAEAWLSTNALAKRPRFEISSNLPVYPQRPGEKDCAHYMLTRTCKFGDNCKFDHPIWVPEGGIPDWKEVPLVVTGEFLPERPAEPDCPYFLKTQKCKFGLRCKFNHPKDKLVPPGTAEDVGASSLPERPSEPPCSFYMKTGMCKFGGMCKFHHPKDVQVPIAGQHDTSSTQTSSTMVNETAVHPSSMSVSPAIMHNSKGLPVRPGEVDCPFYMKTGSCKYGAACRYNHPDRYAINPPAAAIGHTLLASPAASLNIGVANPIGSYIQTSDTGMTQAVLGVNLAIHPQRPGQMECDFYMKTGECKFGERCKFHHPIDRSAAATSMLKQAQENVKLTLAGYPRREGAVMCPYYLKTSTCKYGAACKFDHPPPGEVMAMATSQGTSTSFGEEKGNEKA